MQTTVIDLVEHETKRLPAGDLLEADARLLIDRFGAQVTVVPPTFMNGENWDLRPLGWVGYLPVSERLALALHPKVPIANLFRMFEYAYRVDMAFPQGTFDAASLTEFYERLAHVLAKRVLDRGRRGFYREYVAQADELPFVRGSLDVARHLREPWRVRLSCEFEENTADLEDNRILAWTLSCIARSGLCSDRVAPAVRRAFHAVQGAAPEVPFRAEQCVGRRYNRLNYDYRSLHGLCRFFLAHTGPVHARGSWSMVPFMVDMNRLFEGFVAEWLKAHLPPTIELRFQERLLFGQTHELEFKIDIVLRERSTGRPVVLLDTKYKKDELPEVADVQQVVAYAEGIGCERALLVYPYAAERSFRGVLGRVRVDAVGFPLDGHLNEAGHDLMRQALGELVA